MVGAVVQGNLAIDDRVPGDNTVLHLFLHTTINGRDVFLRHGPANDVVDELVAGTRLRWLDTQVNMAVLAAPTRLAYELVFLLHHLANRLAVSNLWLAHVGIDPELALHAIDDDIEVQFAHPRNNRLIGLLVRMNAE